MEILRNKKKMIFILVIVILTIIAGLYTTYAINVYVEETTPTTYDMAFDFELSGTLNMELTVATGKTKMFDIDITNPYSDSVQYGVAYSMVSPTTLPDNLIIAQLSSTKYPSVGLVSANSTITVSLVIVNNTSSSATISFSIINGYKNGGELIVPDGKTLVEDTYNVMSNKTDLKITNITVDGNTTTFPTTGTYIVEPNCTGATATYDYFNKKFLISNLTTGTICSPVITSTSTIYLNNHIISLAGTTQGNGQVVNENGYRYEGKNPNNYIKFNNELWRIIGVFDSTSHGITNTYLTKIIRNDSIGGHIWDNDTSTSNYGSNNWSDSDLYTILNNYYYNSLDGTSSGNCYQYSTTVPGNCDYKVIGIQNEYRDMVKNVTWYLGGSSTNSYTAETFYGMERASNVKMGNAKTITGYVGLMYPSDYGYSVLSSSCARTTSLGSYGGDGSKCLENSWLKKESKEFTLTHDNETYYGIYVIDEGGYIVSEWAINNKTIRPVIYLDTSVYISDGSGTVIDPYVISI